MKLNALFFITLFCSFVASAQINTPSASPSGSVTSTVGLTEVSIDYFRPKTRGRAIFGEGDTFLVPFDELWRTGAGDGTVVSFSTEVLIDHQKIAAGKYLMLTIPSADQWTLYLYKDLKIDGANLTPNFDKNKVVLKTTVTPKHLTESVQSLSFQISDINAENTSAAIQFSWDKTGFKLPFEVSFDEIIMDQIAAADFKNPRDYITAARYYYNYDKDLDQALEWVNAYLKIDDNDTHFWYLFLNAQILAKMGKEKEAIKIAERTIELAEKSERGDLGYSKRSQAIIDSFN